MDTRPQNLRDLELQGALQDVMERYPATASVPWKVIREKHAGRGHAEFYHPMEGRSPSPGEPTIGISNPDIRGERLRNLLLMEMSHYLPEVDDTWNNLRNQYADAMTQEQLNDAKKWQTRYGDNRSFDRFMQMSGLDQLIGAYLFPVLPGHEKEWSRYPWTPEQKEIMENMRSHLMGQY